MYVREYYKYLLHRRAGISELAYWSSGSGEEDFKILSMYFCYFVIISPWKRTGPFIWTNLGPLYPRMLCDKFAWIGPVVLEKIFFEIRQCIFAISVVISPWKKAGPFIWTNLNPLHPRMLCAKFGWNWLSGSREEDKNVKSLWQHQQRRQQRRQRRTTDKFW